MREILFKIKQKTYYLNYGRDIVASMGSDYFRKREQFEAKVLDIGLGEGWDLENIRKGAENTKLSLFGIECYEPNAIIARQKGIEVASVDIERQSLPFGDASMDLIVANQIIEHTKEIFWIFSEIARVLKPGGACIVGVPNLASLHNRIALFFGMQPTTIELLGPHVRGITAPSFKNFITYGDYFQVSATSGANFYPFPSPIGAYLGKVFPCLSVCLFFSLLRTRKKGSFLGVLDDNFYETPFFRGQVQEKK